MYIATATQRNKKSIMCKVAFLVVVAAVIWTAIPSGVAMAQKEPPEIPASQNDHQDSASAGAVVGVDSETTASAEQVGQWILDLDSDRYIVRRTATDKLILAGKPAIAPLTDVVPTASLEVVTRGIHILQELAANADYATGTAAFQSLEKLAEQRATAAARRAKAALVSMANFRRDRAAEYLRSLGAVIGTDTVREGDLRTIRMPSVTLNANWTGSHDDIKQLRWIVNADGNYVEPMLINSNWLLILEGEKFDDGWLKSLTDLEGVEAIRLTKTKITSKGIRYFCGIKDLEFIDILYTPLAPQSIEQLAVVFEHFKASEPLTLRLYGTKLHEKQLAALAAKFNVDIDSREGAFLGISCPKEGPCQITYVGEGTAAQQGGLQLDDVITKYNGIEIQDFNQLMKHIAKNVPGDRVRIEITRLGKQETKDVLLGEWNL